MHICIYTYIHIYVHTHIYIYIYELWFIYAFARPRRENAVFGEKKLRGFSAAGFVEKQIGGPKWKGP